MFAVVLGTLALVSPLDEAGDTYLISAHMLQHVIIADIAPALALVALRGPLLLLPAEPGPAPVRAVVVLRRASRSCCAPASASRWVLVIGAWHVPAVYDYTLTHPTVHDLEHLSFIAVGLLAWTQIVDPARRNTLSLPRDSAARWRWRIRVRARRLLLAGPLYPAYADQTTRLFGLTPLADQQLAGLLMIAEQLAAFAVCSACCCLHALPNERRSAERRPADALL